MTSVNRTKTRLQQNAQELSEQLATARNMTQDALDNCSVPCSAISADELRMEADFNQVVVFTCTVESCLKFKNWDLGPAFSKILKSKFGLKSDSLICQSLCSDKWPKSKNLDLSIFWNLNHFKFTHLGIEVNQDNSLLEQKKSIQAKFCFQNYKIYAAGYFSFHY